MAESLYIFAELLEIRHSRECDDDIGNALNEAKGVTGRCGLCGSGTLSGILSGIGSTALSSGSEFRKSGFGKFDQTAAAKGFHDPNGDVVAV